MLTLAAISLTTPAMLFGAALVILPIAAHLLNRKARQRIVFPSVALLASVSASQSSFFKLRRWVLLLLRCAAVTLAVLAFARPVWLAPGSSHAKAGADSGGGGGGAAVVIVLDLSASTQQLLGDGQTAASRLRSQAVRELGQLRPGTDYANVVFADATPAAAFDTLTRNVAALRDAVDTAAPTDHHGDMAGALTLAGRLLADASPSPASRHLIVFTDAQRTNWESLDDVQLPLEVQLSLRTIADDDGAANHGNTALVSPESRPARPGIDTPAELSVEVAHFANQPARVRVDLFIDGQEVESQWVRVSPNERKRVSFTRRFESAGQHRVQFKLAADDALAIDNLASHVVTCVQRRPVVVVGDANPDRPGSAGYYVTRALAPHNGERDRYRVTHLAAAAVRGDALRGASFVVVGDVDGLDRVAEATLVSHIQNGGAALVFAGSRPARSETLLPWQLVSRSASAKITDGEWSAAELRGFEVEAQDALARLSLGQVWRVRAITPEARVLLRYADGQPALATRPVGQGQVVAATFSPASEVGDLGKYGVFVVLMQSLAEPLTARGDRNGPALAGRPVSVPADAAVDPQGPPSRLETPGGAAARDVVFTLDADNPVATLPVGDRAGFYTWRQGPATLGQAAANVDPRESDLRPMPGDTLASTLARRGAATASVSVSGVGEIENTLRLGGTALWGWMWMAVLGLLCVEMGVLGGWRR